MIVDDPREYCIIGADAADTVVESWHKSYIWADISTKNTNTYRK